MNEYESAAAAAAESALGALKARVVTLTTGELLTEVMRRCNSHTVTDPDAQLLVGELAQRVDALKPKA